MKTKLEQWLAGSNSEFFETVIYWIAGTIVVNTFLQALCQWSKL